MRSGRSGLVDRSRRRVVRARPRSRRPRPDRSQPQQQAAGAARRRCHAVYLLRGIVVMCVPRSAGLADAVEEVLRILDEVICADDADAALLVLRL